MNRIGRVAFSVKVPSTDVIRKSWDKFAEEYSDQIEKYVVANAINLVSKNFVRVDGKAPQRFLEVGCGSGHLAEYMISSKLDFSRMTFTDISEKMVQLTADRLKRITGSTDFDIFVQNAEELEKIADNYYDCVISHLILNVVNDPAKALEAIHRKIKLDGCFIASVLGKAENSSYFNVWETTLKENGINPNNQFRSKHHLGDFDKCQKLFNQAKYSIKEFTTSKVKVDVRSSTPKEIFNQPMSHAMIKEVSDSLKSKIFTELETKIREFSKINQPLEIEIFNFVLTKLK
jgi:ubiquinone/menaquinone biosynthesis C-methylase UbiE